MPMAAQIDVIDQPWPTSSRTRCATSGVYADGRPRPGARSPPGSSIFIGMCRRAEFKEARGPMLRAAHPKHEMAAGREAPRTAILYHVPPAPYSKQRMGGRLSGVCRPLPGVSPFLLGKTIRLGGVAKYRGIAVSGVRRPTSF